MLKRIEYIKNEYAAQTISAYYGRTPKMHIRSYGCQQNMNDGERLKGVLEDIGFEEVEEPQDADLLVFNTCVVREHAEQRVLGNIGALKYLKEANPKLVFAICGCMGEKDNSVEKIKKSYPYIDIVFGTNGADTFPDVLAQRLGGSKRIFAESGVRQQIVESVPVTRASGFRAYLPIMYGCDNFCSYCIVPYVRGRERSRAGQDILKEFAGLVNGGYKEITLLGQNVNSYGKGLEEGTDFSSLLELLCTVNGAYRIRFLTSHPKDASKKLIDTIAAHPQICKHLHLPVQSGSDEILKGMNRGYTVKKYLELIEYAKSVCPEMTFSSDIIVGFPSETQKQFDETVELTKKMGFTQLFTYIYSKRSGTPAADLPDDEIHKVKAQRLNSLLEIQEKQVAILAKSWIGNVYTGLVESIGRRQGTFAARLDNNMIVEFKAEDIPLGEFVNLHITDLKRAILLGELVK